MNYSVNVYTHAWMIERALERFLDGVLGRSGTRHGG